MNLTHAKDALKKYFGYDAFRPLQAEVIQSIYDQKDTILLMPTGGGKSVCFQIPAVTMEGTCVVISPLISLMKDQVEALRANGIRAAFINSSISYQEQQDVENQLFNGHLDLLYTSPEKMVSQDFMPLLRSSKINLIAIDEAHCISAWGHDFRPEYRQLSFLKKQFPKTPLIAVTATADKVTRRDIARQMGVPSAKMFVASFDRPNLSLEVRPGRKRIEQILEFIHERPNQSGIVYCLSRKSTEDLCGKLINAGIKADFYHAGMSSAERDKVQTEFITDRTPIICATIAFGMGIDKSNVRWVIHYNLPKNIEGFYQEIGRAGRDGTTSDTLLFYSGRDVATYRQFIDEMTDAQQRKISSAKLDRMYQYATSLICRRKILLNYFNEHMAENCGNCDICKDPPQMMDGTVIAQKAMSAVARVKEQVGTGLLVDILRGSKSSTILSKGLDKIKTYGAGKDLRTQDWFFYLEQLINQGLLEIAYDDHSKVKLTEASKAVLFNGGQVELVQADVVHKRREKEESERKKRTRKITDRQRVRDELFDHLRQLRLKIARKKGVPPYIVFTDATLEEMAAEKPKTAADLSMISGVGEAKLRDYGRPFLDAIQEFLLAKKGEGLSVKGSTYLETLQLYRQGLSPEMIAAKREISSVTVFSHLAYLYEKGEQINLYQYIDKPTIKKVLEILQTMEEPFQLKPIYEALEEKVEYEKIRMAIAYYNRRSKKA